MADRPSEHPQPGPKPRGRFRRFMSALGRTVANIIVRLYALAILLVVVWAGYTAVAFLVRSVFQPTQVPPKFGPWPTALSAGQLQPELAKAEEMAVPRAPLQHYHTVDRTLPADLHNGCITSGCHNILPHTKRKEIRAFANLHATFLSCNMCHDASITGTTPAMWVDTATGQPTDTPATLRLMNFLQTNADKIKSAPAEVQPTIADLLAETVEISPDPVLHYLQLETTTSPPGSPVWRRAMSQLVEELPNHLRGEYHAKIHRRQNAEDLQRYQDQLVTWAREYQAAPVNSPERKKLHDQIHQGILEKPAACLACHGGTPPRLDFQALGYSPDRAEDLRKSATAQQMQEIQEGRPFYLPRLLEGGNAR